MIMSSSFAPVQGASGFVIGSNPKWNTLLGKLVTRNVPPILNMIPDVENKKKKKNQKTDQELKKDGADISYILTRKPPLYQGISTPEKAKEVYGGSGNYIIGQSLT